MSVVGHVLIEQLSFTNKHLGKLRFAREHIVRIERGSGARMFVRTWIGKAVDKPGEGNSTRSLVLELRTNTTGQLEGVAAGEFPQGAKAKLEKLDLKANWIQFELEGATGRFRIRLEAKDGKLVGEGVPFDAEEDACDIILEPEGAEPEGLPV